MMVSIVMASVPITLLITSRALELQEEEQILDAKKGKRCENMASPAAAMPPPRKASVKLPGMKDKDPIRGLQQSRKTVSKI